MEEQARQFRAFRDAQRSMLDQLSIGVALFDAKRRITFANQPFHRTFALPSGTVSEGSDFEQFLTAARENRRIPGVRDFLQWRRELTEWFRSDEPVEEEWTLPDGTHLRIVAQPMPDGGLVFFAEDQTERMAASAMRDTMLRTRTATFDNLYEALAVFAPDGHLELWNRGFPVVWGIADDALEGHPAAEEILSAISRVLAKPEQAKAIGNVVRAATLDRKNRDGKVELADGRTLSFAGVPLPDGNGLLTVLDITASVDAEEALRERNKALEEADALTSRFLANMSYEFRTPLTSITGFTELLSTGMAGELPPSAREYVDAISDAARRLSEQVENVLDMSQSEAGQLPISPEPIDLLQFLSDLVRSREDDIKRASLSLSLRGDPGNVAQADPQQLRRALSNIVQNAIDATPPGGKILVDLKRRKDGARIVISDNGKGMSSEELSRVLEGLEFANDGGEPRRRSGLGIPLSRQLITAQGGGNRIRLEAECRYDCHNKIAASRMTSNIAVDLRDLAAMRVFGARIADNLSIGDVVALSGSLGAGKTTLARAIIGSLGYPDEVPSPTFTIIETYDPPAVRLPVVHADFYRLRSPGEVEELGLDDYRRGSVLIAEWPERAGRFGGESQTLAIALETVGAGRRAIVTPSKAWLERLP